MCSDERLVVGHDSAATTTGDDVSDDPTMNSVETQEKLTNVLSLFI
jgi:hypothetical protein